LAHYIYHFTRFIYDGTKNATILRQLTQPRLSCVLVTELQTLLRLLPTEKRSWWCTILYLISKMAGNNRKWW